MEGIKLTGKIKTNILIDEDLWKKFKLKANIEGGLKGVSKALEEALKEEPSDLAVANALETMISETVRTIEVSPIRPKVKTSAGKIVRGLRDSTAC
ncbi:MAG: hypothetical protein QXV85_02775 [Candidatus Bathyarchaeia archaeon]